MNGDEDEDDEDDEDDDEDENDQTASHHPDGNDTNQDRPTARRRVTIRRRQSHGNNLDSDRHSFDSLEREMTLKDRQEAMNKRHPFGLPIWKPALYKKSRSVVRRANNALHSSPTSSPELFLYPGNILWCLLFGWWLAVIIFVVSLLMMLIPPNGRIYGLVMRELAFYLLWPFGRYVERHIEIAPSSLETGHSGTSDNFSVQVVDEEEQGTGDEETSLLSGRQRKTGNHRWYTPLVNGFKLGPAGWFYYLVFFTVIAPLLMLVSTICWFCVITIPMAKLNYLLVRHLRRHPLSLRFKSSPSGQLAATGGKPTVILLCTYQAVGWQYYKYTYDGINIIFINLISLVFFVILDEFVLKHHLPDSAICAPPVVFALSLASVIPLSYFIGMGVSSISAQSSMGVAAAINATFGSIIEIILYAVALMSGKSRLVEGSLIGSFLAGVLLMPGMSMLSSSVKRKEQRFNAKSAGVTSTMLIMAIIGALTPTIFYQMFGSFELKCVGCPDGPTNGTIACSRCYYDQLNPTIDPVYQNSVKPLMWLCAAILPSVYFIGLVFSLHTHVDMIWDSSKPHESHRQHHESYYQKLLPGHIISHLIHSSNHQQDQHKQSDTSGKTHTGHPVVTVTDPSSGSTHTFSSTPLAQRTSLPIPETGPQVTDPPVAAFIHAKEPDEEDDEEEMAGHDSPNWGKVKSYTILCGCTILYAIIAEILVDTVDLVMDDLAVDEKFLGLTLFALVPNITEFMNAISFALYGNIVLSMEIGSSYSLQVCLLQIPSMVAFSYWFNYGKEELSQYTFSLVFPRWDVITVIFSVFLLTYTYQEGKANYFKGSILILSYIVLILAFYFTPPFSETSILIGVPLPSL
ncbi:Sodium/calcium exchanger protein-domain-containing protein [Chlamydoabsidia padenii]|nr:Sodium/calcium exchanger protein-domain-containing protein [Chlamydoabsidia padenii]